MQVSQFKKEICPFCDSEMKLKRIEQINKIDAVLRYECECDWEETISLDIRKVDFENIINKVEYINDL